MNSCRKSLSLISHILPIVAGAILLCIALYLFVVPEINVDTSRSCGEFHKVTDFSATETESEGSPLGVMQIYRFTLDGFEGESTPHLMFYARHQYVRVWIGGELAYSLMPCNKNLIGKTVGLNWVKVHLNNLDIGKEIVVEVTPVYSSHADRVPEFLIGSELGVYEYQLKRDLPQIVLSMTAILAGFAWAVLGFVRVLQKKRGKNAICLGFFAILIGVWRFSDLRFVAFIIPDRPVFLAYISIATLMLCIVPVCVYVGESHKNPVFSQIYCVVAPIVCFVQIVLQLFDIKDFRETLILSHIMIVLGVVCVVAETAMNIKDTSSESVQKKMLPLIFVVGIVIDFIIYFAVDSSSDLLFTLASVTIFTMVSGIMSVRERTTENAKLTQSSFTDFLTGLYNRNKFIEVQMKYREDVPFNLGVAYFDLNRLKEINDILGHAAGDRVLKECAAVLANEFPDMAYRIGGDEFIIIVKDVAEEDFYNKIENACVAFDKSSVSVSVGKCWRESNCDIDAQCIAADSEMYSNKTQYYSQTGR
jgi:diguanylate cyclase (GGDEF)-like protein